VPASPASTPGSSTAPSISSVGSMVGRPRLSSGRTSSCASLAACRPSTTSDGRGSPSRSTRQLACAPAHAPAEQSRRTDRTLPGLDHGPLERR
jgi:hypothetical protein